MGPHDFDAWFDKHRAAFPSITRWLKETEDTLDAWQECLADVPLADALEATRLLNIGEEDLPKGFGDHARFVRSIARRIAGERTVSQQRQRQYIGREEVYSCPTCKDEGIVTVVDTWQHRGGYAPLRKFLSGEHAYPATCIVFCTCAMGRGRSPSYNASRMFATEGTPTAAEISGFREWYAAGNNIGRVPEFDGFNNRQAQESF